MTHLGDRISAFVDGELDHDARERVLSHLATCADCRAAADQQRRLKGALAGAGAPAPSDTLLCSLISMSEPGEPTPRERRPLPGGTRAPSLSTQRPTTAPAGRREVRGPGRITPRRRVAYVAAAGALSVSAVAIAGAFAIGEPMHQGPALTPPLDSYTYQHARTSDQIAGDPAFTAVIGVGFPASPTAPGALPR
jgi:anti-sigma factor RsiW